MAGIRQHHARTRGHCAVEGGELAVEHLQGAQGVEVAHGTVDHDGGSLATIERQAACASCVAVDGLGKRQLTGGLHRHIGEDFDDVVEHRVRGHMDAGTLEVRLACSCALCIGGQAHQRCGATNHAADHGSATVAQRQSLGTVQARHQGQVHALQNGGCA